MSYQPPPQRPDEHPADWAMRVLNDRSHCIAVTDDNVHAFVLLDAFRDKPWKLITPRGTFDSPRLYAELTVPRFDGFPDERFRLAEIIWCNDEDGWVAEYSDALTGGGR